MNLKTSKSSDIPAQPIRAIDYGYLFRSLPDAYMLLDLDDPSYTIVDVNEARERLTGVTREQSVGKSLFEVFPDIHERFQKKDNEAVRRLLRRLVRTRRPEQLELLRYQLTDAHGKRQTRYRQTTYQIVPSSGAPQFILVVSQDVTERRDLQAQVALARQQDRLNRQASKLLQERNDELEAINRTKAEFVALASHQLRTPATAVKQYLGMVLQGYVGEISDVQAEMLGKAFESNERQIHIINQILNAARADTGSLVMAPVRTDLRLLVQAIAVDIEPELAARRHRFTVRVPSEPVMVQADLGYLRMAIENIVHNAGVYTPNGGTISMVLERTSRQARVKVSDTGVGIKKADLDKLFVKFSRIHNPLSVQAGGSGIGLYLTAEIVRLHGGSMGVESRIHHGSTFTLSLPLAPDTVKKRSSSGNMRTGLQLDRQKHVQ